MLLPHGAPAILDSTRGREHFHRQVYGGAFEPGSPLSDERGFRLDVIEALRPLALPVVA